MDTWKANFSPLLSMLCLGHGGHGLPVYSSFMPRYAGICRCISNIFWRASALQSLPTLSILSPSGSTKDNILAADVLWSDFEPTAESMVANLGRGIGTIAGLAALKVGVLF